LLAKAANRLAVFSRAAQPHAARRLTECLNLFKPRQVG